MRFLKKDTNIDFIGKRQIAFILSGIIIFLGMLTFLLKGEKNLGIDFTGGLLMQMEFDKIVSIEELRQGFKTNNLSNISLQQVSDNKKMYIIRADEKSKQLVVDALKMSFPGMQFKSVREEMVGPVVGKDLRKKGLMAIIIALLGILIYVSFRFEFRFAVGAVTALFHDVLITVGILSFTGKEITLQVLAALLTIVGYSLNDTIVVFDRIRETMVFHKRDRIDFVVNKSINQTLSRTILTSATTLFVVASLFFFGGEVIHDFAFALLIGIMVGTYSSIFIASPVLLLWDKAVHQGKE